MYLEILSQALTDGNLLPSRLVPDLPLEHSISGLTHISLSSSSQPADIHCPLVNLSQKLARIANPLGENKWKWLALFHRESHLFYSLVKIQQ